MRSRFQHPLAIFALAMSACATRPEPIPPVASISACEGRERDRRTADAAEREKYGRSLEALDASYGEALLPLLASPRAEARHDALERYLQFPDLLPQRREAFEAVLAMLDDDSVIHSQRCKKAAEGNYLADGIRFAQASCTQNETFTYARGAAYVLRLVGELAADNGEAVENAVVTYVLAHPAKMDLAKGALAHRRVAVERLAKVTSDAERVTLLHLILKSGSSSSQGERGLRWEVLGDLLEAKSPEVRSLSIVTLLQQRYVTEARALRARALAMTDSALADPKTQELVERELAASDMYLDELRGALLARARAGSGNALRVLARGGAPSNEELRVVVDILRNDRRVSDYEPAFAIIRRAPPDAAANTRLAVLAALRYAPSLVENAARALAEVPLTEAEFAELLSPYRARCLQKPRHHVLERPLAECPSTRDALAHIALRTGLRMPSPL